MNEQAFMLPKKFEYQPVRRDESELVQKPVMEVSRVSWSEIEESFSAF